MKARKAAELAMLVNAFTPAELASVLRLIADRLHEVPEHDHEHKDFDALVPTVRHGSATFDQDHERRHLQALVHQAYEESGFAVVDMPDGHVGISNANPQIVQVTNRLLELLLERHKLQLL